MTAWRKWIFLLFLPFIQKSQCFKDYPMVLVLFSNVWNVLVYPRLYPSYICSVSWLCCKLSFTVWENYPAMPFYKLHLVINLPACRAQIVFPLFTCFCISYLWILYNVFRLHLTPSYSLTLSTFSHLTTTFQLYILILLFNHFPSIISAGHVHLGVRSHPWSVVDLTEVTSLKETDSP